MIAQAPHLGTCGPAKQYEHALRRDVTGDGRSDRVWLAHSGCGWTLRVRSGNRLFRVVLFVPVSDDDQGSKDWPDGGTPNILGAANFDGSPGVEVVVQVAHGASGGSYRIYRLHGGVLRTMGIQPPTVPSNSLGIYATAAAETGFVCLRPRVVGVYGSQTFLGRGGSLDSAYSLVTRRRLILKGNTWRPTPGVLTYRVSASQPVAPPIFAGCT